jgi:hypothetical protein
MKNIELNQEEFLLFNEYDQFGFFYNDDGYPTLDSREKFASNVSTLFKKYLYISVDYQDNIYGINDGVKDLLMKYATEAYEIATEVKLR